MFYDEEFKELKQGIKGMVLLFKAIWDEVDQQFSQLPRDERFRIFSIIAPVLTDLLTAMEDMEVKEESSQREEGR